MNKPNVSFVRRVQRALYWRFVRLAGVMLVPVIAFIRLFRPIRLRPIDDQRLGNLMLMAERFLRSKQAGDKDWSPDDIVVASRRSTNSRIMETLESEVHVIYCTWLRIACLHAISFFPNFQGTRPIPFVVFDPDLSARTERPFQLTRADREYGARLLAEMGVPPGAPYVCFAMRDPGFLRTSFPDADFSYHDHRNPNPEPFLRVAEYLADKGYWLIRMGASVVSPLPTKHPRIIDYATRFRTEAGDVFLMASCKFFVGDSSGTYQIAHQFGVPCVLANMPYSDVGFCTMPNIWLLPAHYQDRTTGETLTYREANARGILSFSKTSQFEQANVAIKTNPADEFIAAVEELEARIAGTWQDTPEDGALAEQYWATYPEQVLRDRQREFWAHNVPQVPWRFVPLTSVSTSFLRRNKHLFQ